MRPVDKGRQQSGQVALRGLVPELPHADTVWVGQDVADRRLIERVGSDRVRNAARNQLMTPRDGVHCPMEEDYIGVMLDDRVFEILVKTGIRSSCRQMFRGSLARHRHMDALPL